MATAAAPTQVRSVTLARSRVNQFSLTNSIYDPGCCQGLYRIVSGLAAVGYLSPSGGQKIVSVLSTGEFFGQTGIMNSRHEEFALAVTEGVEVEHWTSEELKRPLPAEVQTELTESIFRQFGNATQRVDDLLRYDSEQQMALALLDFAQRFGRAEGNDVILPAMSQEFLSGYIGTTRSRVSAHMKMFRCRLLIEYSSQNIRLIGNRLSAWLESQSE